MEHSAMHGVGGIEHSDMLWVRGAPLPCIAWGDMETPLVRRREKLSI